MKVAVLGSGGGGLAVAQDFSAHGHEVRLFDFENFPDNIRAVKKNGGISAEGDLKGFAPVKYSGHDIGEALKGAELVARAQLRGGLFLAALPARNTEKVLNMVKDVYPHLLAARNIMQTSLQNGNPVIHPAISLLNVGLIERTGGDFYFYEDGVTPAVGRLVEAVDKERLAVAKKLGVNVLPDPELGMLQGYQTENNYDTSYQKAPGYKGIKAQSSLDYRYFNEDVGYGLVFMSRLGAQIGVPTPHMDSIITLVSTIMQRDYSGEQKRTMDTLGLGGKSAEELKKLLT